MKSKRKKDVLALVSFELSTEDRFGQRERMSDVQVSVTVGVRKRDHEGFLVSVRIDLESFGFFPALLHFTLVRSQSIELRCVSLGLFDRH